MAVSGGPCPNCGSPVEFRAGASTALVCKYCKHIVVRTDRDLRNMGQVADVVFSDVGLAPGDRGTFRGRSFSVEGRLVFQHPQGGTWEEYYAVFDGRTPAWISEAQGYWQVVTIANLAAPPLSALGPRMPLPLAPYGTFIVQEKNEGTLLSAEGELPFAAVPGQRRIFVDLSAAGGGWASIDYGDGTIAPAVFVGVQTTFAEFQITARADRPRHEVTTQGIPCPSCGAPLPLLSPGTERAACPHCFAVSDVALQQVVAKQALARERPSIALGTKGVLPVADARGLSNAEWTVLAYVERSTGEPGTDEWFGWQEYLLYNPSHGYRWLVYDEGTFSFVTPLAAADVDSSQAPTLLRMNGVPFRKRNAQQARVDFVLGELYWKVEVGEVVWAVDYVHGRDTISVEMNMNESSFSFGRAVSTSVIETAFGYVPKASAYGADVEGPNDGRSPVVPVAMFLSGLVLVALVLRSCVASIAHDRAHATTTRPRTYSSSSSGSTSSSSSSGYSWSSSGSSSSSGSVRGSSYSGGFGGK